jgi:hypothetical protein
MLAGKYNLARALHVGGESLTVSGIKQHNYVQLSVATVP